MYCSNCGSECASTFCPNCGARQNGDGKTQPPIAYMGNPPPQAKGVNIWGVVAFIVSLIVFYVCAEIGELTVVTGSAVGVSICLTILAFRAANHCNKKKGFTITALVFCCLSVCFLLQQILD